MAENELLTSINIIIFGYETLGMRMIKLASSWDYGTLFQNYIR